MSLLEVNKLSPNEKLLSGCGDGIRNGNLLGSPLRATRRTPVPSCRRFCTRPSPTQQNQSSNVKVQLQKAILELATHPNITRRRALTIAEINPTRNITKKDGLSSSSPGTRAKASVVAAPRREEDAGRRVYQLLLLNAWRRRRTQVATLTESLGAFETQNGQLELQIDALKRLRMSESEKRAEAVGEIQHLNNKVEKLFTENQILQEEKAALEEELKLLEDKTECMELSLQNTQNDWMTARGELRNTEHQLGSERGKIKKLRDEKQSLMEQLSRKEYDIRTLQTQMKDIQHRLLDEELKLQDSLIINSSYEQTKQDLLQTLNMEIITKTGLQEQLQEMAYTKAILETKIKEFRKGMHNSKESKKKLEEENRVLKTKLANITEALLQEQQQPWWKSAEKLAVVSLNSLKNVAYIMLPAIPRQDFQITATANVSTSM